MKSPKITPLNAAAQLKSLEAALMVYKKKNRDQKAKLDGNTPERNAIGSYKKATEELIEKCKAMIAEYTIDPALQAPPAKKPRREEEPRHRKIIEIEPIEAVAESINSRVLTRFSNGWVTHGTAVEATGPTSTADTFPSLCDAAQDIIDQVEDVASKSNFSHSQLKWKVDCNGGPLNVSHLLALRDWLVTCDLMVANIQRKPTPVEKKVPAKTKAIKILVDGKLVTMDATMCIDARRDASMYPGCVENGMEPVKEVLTNRNGREKCISCGSAPRGQAMAARPDPEERPFLKDCKCPLSGAALELWMLKMTGDSEDIPQRGDDQLANHRLSLNPEILKVIGGAIKAASGHDIDTLLTPEIDRLQHTIHWALGRLYSMSSEDGSKYAESFQLLSKKLKETMDAVLDE
ncbi:hypothetical protein C8R44DRAFT_726300 [Mycena epipterygia]|nr:hypothetical protein C8R44DRAFT_726300 [Mycena epipterygia]